jgi:hypothetical protein
LDDRVVSGSDRSDQKRADTGQGEDLFGDNGAADQVSTFMLMTAIRASGCCAGYNWPSAAAEPHGPSGRHRIRYQHFDQAAPKGTDEDRRYRYGNCE